MNSKEKDNMAHSEPDMMAHPGAFETIVDDNGNLLWGPVPGFPKEGPEFPEEGQKEEQETNPKKAHGALKAPFGFTSTLADIEYNNVMAGGAHKYGAFNFRETKIDAMTYIAAIKRHLMLFEDGEDLDEESGNSHLSHIQACCALARDAQLTGMFIDNRNKTGLVAPALKASADKFNRFVEKWDKRDD